MTLQRIFGQRREGFYVDVGVHHQSFLARPCRCMLLQRAQRTNARQP